jgi:hypothetical protein
MSCTVDRERAMALRYHFLVPSVPDSFRITYRECGDVFLDFERNTILKCLIGVSEARKYIRREHWYGER